MTLNYAIPLRHTDAERITFRLLIKLEVASLFIFDNRQP